MAGSVIVAGARTPVGKLSGALASFSASDLGGFAIKAALERAGITGEQLSALQNVTYQIANLDGNQVYDTINGPNEFTTIGNLRYWNRIPDLHQIRVPVLLTCGRYDELGEVCSRTILDRIPDGRLEIFEHSAHVAHAEEPDAYNNTVAAFFRAVENRG